MFSKGMISGNLLEDIQDKRREPTKADRARTLLGAVEDKIQAFPHSFKTLLDILRAGSQFTRLEVILSNKMTELELEDHEEIRSPSTDTYKSCDSGTTEDEKAAYVRYHCACGECTPEEFLDGKDCPQTSAKPGPMLSMWSPAEKSQSRVVTQGDMKFTDYKVSLNKLTQGMETRYSQFLASTIAELKHNVPLRDVKKQLRSLITPPHARRSIYSRMYDRDLTGKLHEVHTYHELQLFLGKNFCSWFNVDLIADLRKSALGASSSSTDLDREKDDYDNQLGQYITKCCLQRSVFVESKKEHFQEVVLVVPTDFRQIKKRQLDNVERTIRKHVCLPECDRKVDDVRGELVFRGKSPVYLQTRFSNAHDQEPLSTHEITPSVSDSDDHSDPEELDKIEMRPLVNDAPPEYQVSIRRSGTGSGNYYNRLKRKRCVKYGARSGVVICALFWILLDLLTLVGLVYFYQPRSYLPAHTENSGKSEIYGHDVVGLLKNCVISDYGNLTFKIEYNESALTNVKIYRTTDDLSHYVYKQSIRKEGTVNSNTHSIVYERYLLRHSNITVMINGTNEVGGECPVMLFIFNNRTDAMEFNSTGAWQHPYVQTCMGMDSTYTHEFTRTSNYHFGLLSNLSTELTFTINGQIDQYHTAGMTFTCEIRSPNKECGVWQRAVGHDHFFRVSYKCWPG